MRCFIGIPLPVQYQWLLEKFRLDWQPRLGAGVSWTRPGNWHLTLKFLGELREDQVTHLLDGLGHAMDGSVGQASIVLRAHGGGFFPDIHRPRVLWVGLGIGARRIARLAAWVEKNCEKLGFACENRPFRAHLTVARIKRPGKVRHNQPSQARGMARQQPSWAEVVHALNRISWPKITVNRMILWESQLSVTGPSYQPQMEWHLPLLQLE